MLQPMKNLIGIISFIALLLIGIVSSAQSRPPGKHNHPSGKMNAAAAGIYLPFGDLSSTHISGIGIEYDWSNYRFGRLDVKPVKPFGFIANAGMTYYFGKNETVSGYPYKYPGYIFIHLYGGIIYNPSAKMNFNLTTGPALGIYNGNTRFNTGGKLEAVYYINNKWGISPAIIMMKEQGVNALWAASINASLCF